MLKRSDKELLVTKLKEDIDKSQAVFLTNLIGIPANDAVSVRRKVREAGGKIVITRNNFYKRAAVGSSCEKLLSNLSGPNALAFAFDDAAAVAKCLKQAGKQLDKVELRGGVLGDQELSVAEVTELADLPSRDEMLGTLLATFMAPISAFARTLYAIQEKKDGKGSEGEAETEAE